MLELCCKKPGWICTIKNGHDGSCAAYPIEDLIEAAQAYIDAKEYLLSTYRIGGRPSEVFWRRYEEAKARWAELTAAFRLCMEQSKVKCKNCEDTGTISITKLCGCM